jgi:hypothetical protein
MKQTKDQPLALKLCTNHKPNIKSADIEKRDTSVSTIVAVVEKTTFFKQYSALTRLQRTAAYFLRLFHNAKNFVAKNSCSTFMTMENFMITSPSMALFGISYHQHQTLAK